MQTMNNTLEKRVLITGASGLLGRAVYKKFTEENWLVTGLAYTRAIPPIIKLDLLNSNELSEEISRIKPHIIVHCAAERRPDVVESNYEKCKKLNVETTEVIAKAARKDGSSVIYISTDYVFNGTNPPYKESDAVDPLNKYGQSKAAGETAVQEIDKGNCVLRIPLLYGEIESLEESGVTAILKELLDPGKERFSSNYEIRHPAHTEDVASVIHLLALKKLQDPKLVCGIYQWSGEEAFTRYQMTRIISEECNLNMDHIKPRSIATPGAKRPFNVKMDNTLLANFGAKQKIYFRCGIIGALKKFL